TAPSGAQLLTCILNPGFPQGSSIPWTISRVIAVIRAARPFSVRTSATVSPLDVSVTPHPSTVTINDATKSWCFKNVLRTPLNRRGQAISCNPRDFASRRNSGKISFYVFATNLDNLRRTSVTCCRTVTAVHFFGRKRSKQYVLTVFCSHAFV